MKALEAAYQKTYRSALRLHLPDEDGQRPSTCKVLYEAKKPPLQAGIRLRRLRYLVALLVNGPTILLEMLDRTWEAENDASGWAAQLKLDFAWIATHMNAGPDDQLLHMTLQAWIDSIVSDPAAFRRLLKQAWDRFRAQQHDEHHRQVWQQALAKLYGQEPQVADQDGDNHHK
eukprot:5184076-Pyramimonas_sp.AAC.1